MFRTLDRYLLREILPPFFLALLVFTFILMIPPVMEVAESLIAKGVPWGTVLRIMGTLVPQALGVTIPMALLVGILMGLGRLSGDRETVALQACGVSLFRFLRPISVLALAAAATNAYILIVALPDANQTFREITYDVITARFEEEVRPRVFFEDFPNIVLYARDVPPEGGGWRDVFLADTRKGDQPEVFVSERGRMIADRAARRVELVLEDGTAHRVDPQKPAEYTAHRFDRMFVALDPDTVFPRTGPQRGFPELTIPELQAEADRMRQQGFPAYRPIMEIHRKLSIPVACLVFALIGVALGVTSRKDGKLASFVLGVGVIFAYYVLMYGAEAFTKGELLSPHVSMWVPNVLMGGLGIALFLWRSRSSERRLTLPFAFGSSTPKTAASPSPAAVPSRRVVVVVRVPRRWVPRLYLLDRYVTRIYLKIVGLAFLGLLGIFYISSFIDLSDKVYRGEASGWMLLEYLWYATPQFSYYVLPIAALVASLVTVGLLTRSSELTVMKACGISLYRAAAPLLAFGAVWSGVLFGLEESVLASANRRAEAIRHVMRGGSPRTFDVLNRKWIVGSQGAIYHYVYLDPNRQELSGLSVYRFSPDSWRLAARLYTDQARFTSQGWMATQGWVRKFGADAGEPMPYESFERTRVSLEQPGYFVTEQPDAQRMSYQQLERYIRDLRASGFNVVSLLVELHRKLSFPFVTIIMTLIAVPFAVTTGRRGALYGVGLGIVLAMTYWFTFSVFAAIGSAGMLEPLLAAWAPNCLFAAGAAYLLLTVRT